MVAATRLRLEAPVLLSQAEEDIFVCVEHL